MALFSFGTQETKTVDSVMTAFQATITDLQSVASANVALAAEQAAVATQARAAQAAAEAEAQRATDIASQMQTVFGVKAAA